MTFETDRLLSFLPGLAALVAVILVLALLNFWLRRGQTGEISVTRQALMLLLTATGVLIVIFTLPLSEVSRGQVLSLLGIVITAVIALSSTTFVANAMAGLMLRAVNSFKPGDFIRSPNFFGKVTERGIFHTEIQTEDRDLMTLPNMYLVNNPVTVVHHSGTIISATLSLGYDVHHATIEQLLNEAAEACGLTDPFTLVVDLNDFSVSYRVGGFTDEVNQLLTIKSKLRKKILSTLHNNGVEIVSPAFMNQRQLDPEQKVLPAGESTNPDPEQPAGAVQQENTPEAMIFDKADSAAESEQLKTELEQSRERLKELSTAIKSSDDSTREPLEREQASLAQRVEELSETIAASKAEN
ncbi:mechanosensitive ion channel family protein [Seongchinamella sediminis]|uniref:Small-conductance mechanosensitive channel n=1 Tax=Seongchinamella sediminis TaxID=2283635 RepID=A0A3L7DV81_9GAMM|nr:mechanosensitive ion channel family protein [Seongchinamella sediminis]RLQ20695.1 mechanosensitive ion channel family protein [Seongchinamella sediminis]